MTDAKYLIMLEWFRCYDAKHKYNLSYPNKCSAHCSLRIMPSTWSCLDGSNATMQNTNIIWAIQRNVQLIFLWESAKYLIMFGWFRCYNAKHKYNLSYPNKCSAHCSLRIMPSTWSCLDGSDATTQSTKNCAKYMIMLGWFSCWKAQHKTCLSFTNKCSACCSPWMTPGTWSCADGLVAVMNDTKVIWATQTITDLPNTLNLQEPTV